MITAKEKKGAGRGLWSGGGGLRGVEGSDRDIRFIHTLPRKGKIHSKKCENFKCRENITSIYVSVV